MEPITLGLAAAALLATKFGEGVAQDAGTSAWKAVKGVVARRFRNDQEMTRVLESAETLPDQENLTTLAERIREAATRDDEFRAELTDLINRVPLSLSATNINAQSYDSSKQAIITGGTSIGTLNL
ncbi:hypothetical protein [Nocardia sp. GTS18]|uniref:hypothetical protein n=1 Tax=Nocardia sp. GTS18 TaxID=1778064 RepID=UPI0015EEE1F2|nr:hypothetical protein [Nocardia sp. GTS18]